MASQRILLRVSGRWSASQAVPSSLFGRFRLPWICIVSCVPAEVTAEKAQARSFAACHCRRLIIRITIRNLLEL